MKGKLRKIGNSQGVILPSRFLKEMKLREDGAVDIEYDEDRNMILIKNPDNPDRTPNVSDSNPNDFDALLEKKIRLIVKKIEAERTTENC
ncbi:AbrB/MazE/SpoVT family DNA-binding domain-containing protein [Bacillus toyonensis]|uniref:AbrB/MazE/SpoVT family DNA-binding domain-containing protein n=1 Tax=Bacillus toyonensis TaxID=155322 RepID=UPI002E1C8E1D|nr:AbrB/MazE/SpoVT family DNA-binding domain-containing protein [Bacillus toyonensis]